MVASDLIGLWPSSLLRSASIVLHSGESATGVMCMKASSETTARHFPAGLTACSLLLCCLPAISSAQGESSPSAAPQEILTTANRFAQFSHEILNAHTLLDRDFITQSGAASMFDLLRTVPGVQLSRTGTEGAQTSLFMRGSNSNHTLILLDGVRMNTASEGAARLESIPLSHIERIEVIRGPQSSVYGADAIGGVVQIFTRSSINTEGVTSNTPGYGGRLEAGIGTEQSRVLNTGLRRQLNRTIIDVDLSHRETEGVPAQNAPIPGTQTADWENQSISLGLQHQLADNWQLWARWQGTDSAKRFDSGDSEGSQRSGSVGMRAQMSAQWQTQLQFSRLKDNNLTREYGLSRSTTRRNSWQWQNSLTLSSQSNTVLGVDMDDEDLLYDSVGAVQNASSRRNSAAFAVHQHKLGAIALTASVRTDDNEQFGSHTTGRLALGRDVGDSHIWIAASTAFKAPTLVDLYVDFPAFDFYANPQLEPERARNLEAGLRTSIAGTALDISIFRNDIRDLIGTDSSFSSLTNISRARIDGVEVSANRDLFGWSNTLSLTLLDHQDRDSAKALLRRPDQQLSITTSRKFANYSLFFDWQLRSHQADLDPLDFSRSRVGGYGVLDTVLAWQLMPALELQLKLGNLFDKNYEVVDGYNTLGRHAMLSARHQF